ncbi:MAG TPA: prepilin peptidase [Candidatus Saccharimonadales bacterium]|nr:prepilin peptidase [Candidatus Saccharimonadales bacterium]
MFILILAILGLCLGSFVNAFVWRFHKQETSKKLSKKQKQELSIMHGRSMCPHCQHQLAAKDLIPIVSWLMLKGRCRYCHQKIEDSPIVEFTTATLFLVSYIYWPMDFNTRGVVLFGFWLIFLVGFMALSVYDIRWFLLPDKIVYPLFGLAWVQILLITTVFSGGTEALLGSIWGLLIGGGLFYVLFQISGGKWIGGGDVKLGAVLGLLVGGPAMSLMMLFTASLLGTVFALPLLVAGKVKKTSHIPFGPFLILAAVIVYIFGSSLITWYKHKFLLY